MRKSLLTALLLLLAVTCGAQELKKGSLVGTHLMTVKLQPGVTMEQYTRFYMDKLAPEWEKATGWKIYHVTRIRGEKADGLAVFMVVASQADRDRYYDAEGNPTEAGKAAMAKVQPTFDALGKLGTVTTDLYTDWLVN